MKIINQAKFDRLPDVFFFDLDNTLYPYSPAHNAAIQAVSEKVRRQFSIVDSEFDAAYREARVQIKEQLSNTAASHSRLLYLQRFLEIIGLGSQVLLALDLEQTYWRTFLNNAVLFDQVKDLLDDIRLLDVPMVMVTDLTAHIQFRKIIYLNLDRYFDYVVTSEEAGYDKPSDRIFRLALEKVSPKGDRVWMIGDNPEKDIWGARETIGAITLQKIHNGNKTGVHLQTPDASFREFAQLRAFIAALNG